MIRHLIGRKLDSAEKELGQSLDYARHILRTSLRSFLVFTKILSVSSFRRRLPVQPSHVARLVATADEECGTCLQIELDLALKDGLPASLVEAVVAGRPEALPPELADVFHFTRGVVGATGEEDALRERIRKKWGEPAFVELALAIASCRCFPIVKRALGYARSCRQVELRVGPAGAASAKGVPG